MAVIERRAAALVLLAAVGVVACTTAKNERPGPAPFGKLGDTPVQLYTLTNTNGLVARITNYGAIVTELHVPDKDGSARGRRARLRESRRLPRRPSRTSARSSGASPIASATPSSRSRARRYTLAPNDKPHHLHGGTKRLGQGGVERHGR